MFKKLPYCQASVNKSSLTMPTVPEPEPDVLLLGEPSSLCLFVMFVSVKCLVLVRGGECWISLVR